MGRRRKGKNKAAGRIARHLEASRGAGRAARNGRGNWEVSAQANKDDLIGSHQLRCKIEQ